MLDLKKIPKHILNNIRQNMGTDPGDKSEDATIEHMTPIQAFGRWTAWQGLLGTSWATKISEALDAIRNAEVKDYDEAMTKDQRYAYECLDIMGQCVRMQHIQYDQMEELIVKLQYVLDTAQADGVYAQNL